MAPKSQRQNASEKAKDVQETEDPLQALVLADSFETRFHPFTIHKPRCLLPLANTPLIEYTLEFLAFNGVEEVFLYCGAHTDQVEEYINKSKWTGPSSPFKLELIRSNSRSVGDAMRDLDKRGPMKRDFIMVYGDVVSNLPLTQTLAEHKARRDKDKNAIMTMVLREGGKNHRGMAQDFTPFFLIDPEKQRCHQYEQLVPGQSGGRIPLNPRTLLGRTGLDMRSDLIDSGIDICSPDVLALYNDYFDKESPRKGFLQGMLKDYELNGKTVHTKIISDHYAARVRNLQAYESITKDVLAGWAYPMSPDSNLCGDQSFRALKNNCYVEDSVSIPRSATLDKDVLVGRGSSLAEGVHISDSVIGRDCKIGKGCNISGSVLWDNVELGNNVKVENAIIADSSRIGPDSTISSGSIISSDVVVPAYATVQSKSCLIGKRKRTADAPKDGDSAYETKSLEETGLPKNTTHGSIYGRPEFSTSDFSVSTLDSDSPSLASSRRSSISATSDFGSTKNAVDSSSFIQEASSSIHDSLAQGMDVANIQLELQALRLASNASDHSVRAGVAVGLGRWLVDARKQKKSMKTVIEEAKLLIDRSCFEEDDEVDFLLLLQDELAKSDAEDAMFSQVCKLLYAIDFAGDKFEGERFEEWWANDKSQSSEELKRVRNATKEFIDFLVEDSDEEDDDDEDSD